MKKKNNNIALLKFICAIGIVFIHVGNTQANITNDLNIFYYFQTFFWKFAVPTFFIISGFFYYGSKNKFKSIKRNFSYWVCISIIYISINFIAQLLGFEGYHLGRIFWFFRVLVLLQIILYYQNKYYIGFLFIIFLIPRLHIHYDVSNIFSVQAFMIPFTFGMIMKKIYTYKNDFIASLFLITGIFFSIINILYFHMGQYDNIPLLASIFIFTGVLTFKYEVKERNIYNNSINFYLWHMVPLSIIIYINKYFLNIELFSYKFSITTIAIFIVIILLIMFKLIKKYIFKNKSTLLLT